MSGGDEARRGFPVDPTSRIVLGGVPADQPYPVGDELGRELTVGQLFNLVARVPTPSAIGLFGPWGSGKSTLLHLLAARLREQAIGEVIELDPWVYESEGSPLRALVWKIQALTRARSAERAREVPWAPLRDLALAVTPVLGTGLAVAVGGPVAAVTAGGVALAASVVKELSAWWKARGEATSLEGRPPVEVFREVTRALLQDLAGRAQAQGRSEGPAGRVIVLIDDLDRCLPESMLSLLQATRLLFCGDPSMPVVFVFALDREQVVSALRQHYARLDSSHAERFLEKIFDYSLWVPPWPDKGLSPAEYVAKRVGYPQALEELLGPLWRTILEKRLDIPAVRSPRLLHRLASKLVLLAAVPMSAPKDVPVWRDGRLTDTAVSLLVLSCYNPGFRSNLLHRPDQWRAFFDVMESLWSGSPDGGNNPIANMVADSGVDRALADLLQGAGVLCPTSGNYRHNVRHAGSTAEDQTKERRAMLAEFLNGMHHLSSVSQGLATYGL